MSEQFKTIEQQVNEIKQSIPENSRQLVPYQPPATSDQLSSRQQPLVEWQNPLRMLRECAEILNINRGDYEPKRDHSREDRKREFICKYHQARDDSFTCEKGCRKFNSSYSLQNPRNNSMINTKHPAYNAHRGNNNRGYNDGYGDNRGYGNRSNYQNYPTTCYEFFLDL